LGERKRLKASPADPIGLYLDEVSSHSLLTAEDEVRLARAMEDGAIASRRLAEEPGLDALEMRRLRSAIAEGEAAKATFIRSNLRLVISIAKRYSGRGLDLLDLVQEGNLGLIRAVEKFDWRRGFKFSTYATWWIRQAITRGLGNGGRTIRLPVHMVDIVRTVTEANHTLAGELQRPPTAEEIAELSGLDMSKVIAALEAPIDTVSLDKPVGEDGDSDLGEFVVDIRMKDPYVAAAEALRKEHIDEALESLDPTERTVITLRFGIRGDDPWTLSAVGKHLGMTREHIRQIESRALARLRHPANLVDFTSLL
jgi:RNA polymerase primary sigma factor